MFVFDNTVLKKQRRISSADSNSCREVSFLGGVGSYISKITI